MIHPQLPPRSPNALDMLVGLLVLFLHLPTMALADDIIHPRPYQRKILLTGFTRAKQIMTVSSEVAGKCLKVFVDKGDNIPPSGQLAAIDSTFLVLDLRANKLAQEKIQLQLANERKTLERYTTLHGQKSVPQATLDEVSLNAELHQIALENLRNEQRRLEEQQTRYFIQAPPGWKVLERLVEPGEFVQSGQSIARLGDYRQVIVPLALSINELESLRQTQDIPLLLPDLNTTVSGKIYRISPGFDAKIKKIPVELILETSEVITPEILRGGLRVQLHLNLQEKSNVFLLPLSAIIQRYDAHWVVRSDGKREKVIFLGTSQDGLSAIISAKDLSTQDKLLKTIPPDFKP